MSIFIKIDILKPSLIHHFKKKVSIIINIEQKSVNYAIYNILKSYKGERMILRGEGGDKARSTGFSQRPVEIACQVKVTGP
jgi:hypothetical protein